jgi:hemin uptake protein HemP
MSCISSRLEYDEESFSLLQRGPKMSSRANSIREMPSIVSETNADKRKSATLDSSKTIHSDTLFSDGDVVFIQHEGAQYRLRRTRDGKLILSK